MAHLLIGRPRRLPIPICLVRHETIGSYLARLARANHLDIRELTGCLDAPARTSGPHRFDRLAALTGHPVDRLRDMLATTVHPRRQHRHEACRRCTAQHGIRTTVHLAAPAHRTTCRRHRRWLPAGYWPAQQQYDLRDVPEILTAQRRHARLVHEHGDHATGFVRHAAHITERWTHRGDWPEHRNRRLQRFLDPNQCWISETDPLIAMANYPETITLAQLLAAPHWTQLAISDDHADITRFHAEVSRRLDIAYQPYAPHDPLLDWQQHSRALRHHPEIAQLL